MKKLNTSFDKGLSLQSFLKREVADIQKAYNSASSTYLVENMLGGIKEAKHLFGSYVPRFLEKSSASKAFSLARGAIVFSPLLPLLSIDQSMPWQEVLKQSASALTLTSILASACCIGRIPNNNNKNAFAVPVIGALALENFATGATGFGIFSTAIASYYALMASMPDTEDMEPLRKKMGTYFGVSGVGTILTTAQSPWEIVSAISLAFNTASTAQIASNSHRARALKTVTHILNTIYGVGYSESNSAELMGVLGLSAEAATISENDIPKGNVNGQALTRVEQAKGYIACLKSPERRSEFSFKCNMP